VRYDIDFPRHEAANFTSQFNFTDRMRLRADCREHCSSAQTAALQHGMGEDLVQGHCATRRVCVCAAGTNGKLVLRGGGAVIYGPLQYSDFGGSMTLGYSQFRQIGSNYTGPGTRRIHTGLPA